MCYELLLHASYAIQTNDSCYVSPTNQSWLDDKATYQCLNASLIFTRSTPQPTGGKGARPYVWGGRGRDQLMILKDMCANWGPNAVKTVTCSVLTSDSVAVMYGEALVLVIVLVQRLMICRPAVPVGRVIFVSNLFHKIEEYLRCVRLQFLSNTVIPICLRRMVWGWSCNLFTHR